MIVLLEFCPIPSFMKSIAVRLPMGREMLPERQKYQWEYSGRTKFSAT